MDEAEAFGRDFGSLMRRLEERHAARLSEGDGEAARLQVRRETAAAFRDEVEKLIAGYGVTAPVAEYVRHVVREGFEAAFDAMDPTDETLRARQGGALPDGSR